MTAAAVPDGGGDEQLTSMTLVEHLTELRSRLMKSIIAIAVGSIVVYALYSSVLFPILKAPLCTALEETNPGQECQLVITDPLQGFSTRLTISGYGGIVLAMPVLLWQIWKFITPGLYPREKRLAIPFVASGVLLFLAGAGIAYWSLQRALAFLIDIGGDVDPFFTPDRYVGFIVKMTVAFGIGFEFPIVLIFLQLAGILTPQQLARSRRYAIVGIVILAAVVTPSGDPYTLGFLSIPLYLFFELSILIGRLSQRRRRKKNRAA